MRWEMDVIHPQPGNFSDSVCFVSHIPASFQGYKEDAMISRSTVCANTSKKEPFRAL